MLDKMFKRGQNKTLTDTYMISPNEVSIYFASKHLLLIRLCFFVQKLFLCSLKFDLFLTLWERGYFCCLQRSLQMQIHSSITCICISDLFFQPALKYLSHYIYLVPWLIFQ